MKSRLFNEIARRIAGDGELGKDDQFGVSRRGVLRETNHQGDVAREVADGGIDLPEGNPHQYLILTLPMRSDAAGRPNFDETPVC